MGYLALYTTDWFSLQNKKLPKVVANLLGTGLLVYAHFGIGLGGNDLKLDPTLRLFGLGAIVVFGIALVYSLYFEISFSNSYIKAGENTLISTGTYALCRHPGVFWYIFFAIGLMLASSHFWAIYAAPIWISMNILFAWIQDRFYFPRLFSGYMDYKKATPFLIPSNVSIAVFLTSFKP